MVSANQNSNQGGRARPIPIGEDHLQFKHDPQIQSQLDHNGKKSLPTCLTHMPLSPMTTFISSEHHNNALLCLSECWILTLFVVRAHRVLVPSAEVQSVWDEADAQLAADHSPNFKRQRQV